MTGKGQNAHRLLAPAKAVLISIVIMMGLLIAPGVHAQQAVTAEQAEFPAVSIKNQTVSGTAVFSFDATGFEGGAIEIAQVDGRVIAQRQFDVGEAAIFEWDTTSVYDGQYLVKYLVTDATGQQLVDQYALTVVNGRQYLTLNPGLQQNRLEGQVLQSEAKLQVYVNGQQLDGVPTVSAQQTDSGMFDWSLELPSSLLTGAEAQVQVRAMLPGDEQMMAAQQLVVLAPVLPVVPPPQDTIVVTPEAPPLQLAEEIEQFIAPPLQADQDIQLYGVSVADLLPPAPRSEPEIAAQLVPPKVAPNSVQANDIELSTEASPLVRPSPGGWVVLGVAWYWWALILVAIAGAVGLVLSLRRREVTRVHATS